MTKLLEINGNEIIDFLNALSMTDELDDYNIVAQSFEFNNQRFMPDEKRYILDFSLSYNNWGEDQIIEGNHIDIDENLGIAALLSEPFEGNAEEAVEDVLYKWIREHEFNQTPEEDFRIQLRELYQKMAEISFNDITAMDELIEGLQQARSLMKSYPRPKNETT